MSNSQKEISKQIKALKREHSPSGVLVACGMELCTVGKNQTLSRETSNTIKEYRPVVQLTIDAPSHFRRHAIVKTMGAIKNMEEQGTSVPIDPSNLVFAVSEANTAEEIRNPYSTYIWLESTHLENPLFQEFANSICKSLANGYAYAEKYDVSEIVNQFERVLGQGDLIVKDNPLHSILHITYPIPSNPKKAEKKISNDILDELNLAKVKTYIDGEDKFHLEIKKVEYGKVLERLRPMKDDALKISKHGNKLGL